MEGRLAHLVAESGGVLLLKDVNVGPAWLGRFGGTVIWSDAVEEYQHSSAILFRDLALLPPQPVHLPSADLPFVAQDGLKLGVGHARGQPPADELEARCGSLGTAGCL